MRVREDHAIHALGIKWQGAIARVGFLAAALKHATLQEHPVGVGLDEMHGAGDSLRRAQERDLHIAL